ncbi:4-hydroxythreonine-4-phosphate dehydrogenase PdxA [Calditerrivibrio nitroreducens]|uniref:4-hydroxythreonine-4-phosphate dehydrogenase n=1 Tax=Calditerrivibrio nitroreducens (strain DSM 19672 / NBRC 101217 / Yu37-1) TaxID=768670 RepID=E4TGS3_CALNY|nr:4-hydroxythreonine-4-phosphate dehydrogenase PdxA [Calditerrivibrio nitroreducens]ADR18683.1 4-hydroxythreonine-4-phosphate dehydrogenase [Calditerrivibrio nitroreducens DSM 19672]
MKNRIAITMGDPSGIGPEIIFKLFKNHNLENYDIKVVGIKDVFKDFGNINFEIIEPEYKGEKRFPIGKVNAESGMVSMLCVELAVSLALKREIDAIVTAPINKKSISIAGFPFPGHTEFLAHLTGSYDYSMMLVGDKIKTVLVTTHSPIKSLPDKITQESVLKAIKNAHNAGKYFGNDHPHVAVCGLNPHAGDEGAIGNEEEVIIKPAIEEGRKIGINATGPYPADSLFAKMLSGFCDIAVAMYHDQGLIPVKMESFGNAVNVTLNLPIIRTSVDHGTAFDIAGKNIASELSLLRAIKTADIMINNVKSTKYI